MTPKSFSFRLLLLLAIAIFFNSCNESTNKRNFIIPETDIDTSRMTVLSFKEFSYVFDSSYTEAVLTQQDFTDVDSLIQRCIYTYNKSYPEINQRSYGLQDSFRQYIAAINSKGEKEVWINCFCRTDDKSWKKTIVPVFEGGSCYYHLKINLTTKKYYDLGVNGKA